MFLTGHGPVLYWWGMPKYRLDGRMTVGVSVDVEAEDAEHALEVVGQEILAQTVVGDGGTMVALSVRDVSFDTTDCYPEWTDAELVG